MLKYFEDSFLRCAVTQQAACEKCGLDFNV